MNLENIIAVTGMPGLYKMVGSRSNGLIVEDFDSGKKKFASLRKHQFTPLDSVSIYTMMDTAPLKDVFIAISKRDDIPEANSGGNALTSFFGEVLPDYDEDKVLVSDIKKILKWFKFLSDRNLLTGSDEEE